MCVPNVYELPLGFPEREDVEDATAVCHSDYFLTEGYEIPLQQLDWLPNQHLEVTEGPLFDPGHAGHLSIAI